jgi:hypothetical protein
MYIEVASQCYSQRPERVVAVFSLSMSASSIAGHYCLKVIVGEGQHVACGRAEQMTPARKGMALTGPTSARGTGEPKERATNMQQLLCSTAAHIWLFYLRTPSFAWKRQHLPECKTLIPPSTLWLMTQPFLDDVSDRSRCMWDAGAAGCPL